MSLCLLILRPDDAYIAGDSRVSVEIDDVHYRWHDKYSKIEMIDQYVIFKGGSADITNSIVDSFSKKSDKTINKLYDISKFEFKKYINKNKQIIGSNETEALLLILHMENRKPVVDYIYLSEKEQPQLQRVNYQDNGNGIMDIIAGDPYGKAYNIFKSCHINYDDSNNVFQNYIKVYQGVVNEQIGGNLTFYHLSNQGTEKRIYQLKDSKPIRQLYNDSVFSLLNCKNNVQGSLKINDQEALTEDMKISSSFIETLEVGKNVLMGANAYISWDKVTNQPTILSANDIKSTVITKDWIATLGLKVGTEIQMGSNATISWSQVTGTPSIPTKASDIGALPDTTAIPVLPNYIKSTYIDSTTVQSPNIVGGLITGSVLQTADTSAKRIVINTEGITSYDGAHKSGFFAKAGTYSEGALGINHMGNSAISIHWNGQGEGTFECGGNLHIHAGTGSYKTFFSGNVDFGGATVTGISTVAKFG